MKTQLLEDIGENASLSLAPATTGGNPKAGKEVQTLAPAGNTEPAGEPPISTTQQPVQRPAPLELHSVFEEIAALEAQFVPPAQQHEPGIAPAEPRHEISTSPAEPLLKPAAPPAEPTPVPDAMQSPTVPQDPLFDFTLPSPAYQAADPFTRPPTGLTRSRQRYLLWGACVLSGALLILGGRWLYQERNDAGALALIAGEAKEVPQAVAPAVPASRPLPAVPPLVLLEPDPSPATRLEPTLPSTAGRVEPQAPPKPDAVAEQEPASPLPTPSSRRTREQSAAAAEPARERSKREPVRQPVRASAIGTERPSGQDTTMTATLKACREHGYGAAECVKRACSLTRYGFACRGR
ncbi:MAG: hypothetical protein JWP72_2051 [Massilia sp.]|nr:hypothetical protein [Massilia sp.]